MIVRIRKTQSARKLENDELIHGYWEDVIGLKGQYAILSMRGDCEMLYDEEEFNKNFEVIEE